MIGLPMEEGMEEKPALLPDDEHPPLAELRLRVPSDLVVAYQRCSWIIVHETGRPPLSVMEEMVRDFLIKHGC